MRATCDMSSATAKPSRTELHVSPTLTRTFERFALDGPIQLSLAVSLGGLLVVLCGWLLWRERRVLGRRLAFTFWGLRAAALVTAIWMLLAPTNVRVEVSTARRAVSFVVDASGSMNTIDPPGTSDDVRWALAGTNTVRPGAIQAVDKAVAAVSMAERQLTAAIEAMQRHEPESTFTEAITRANRALRRAVSHLQSAETLSSGAADAEAGRLVHNLVRRLQDAEFAAFDQLCAALEKNRAPSQKGWRESLPDLAQRLVALRRPLNEVARQIAQQASVEGVDPTDRLRKASRITRVASALGQLSATDLRAVREKADVHWNHFDERVTRMADQGTAPPFAVRSPQSDKDAGVVPATDLAEALAHVNRQRPNQPLGPVFVYSDMVHTASSTQDPRDVSARMTDTPIYLVPIGNRQHVRDVQLQSVYAPTVAMRNDEIVVEVSLQAYQCAGEVGVVQLLQEGAVVDFREVQFDSDFSSRSVRFHRAMPAVGSERFQVAFVPLEGELTEGNNYQPFEVNVTRSDIKVLLADELPRWEYRYLSQLFRRDAKVDCDELLFHPRLIATGRREQDQALPTTADQWDQYDVVILGDLVPEHFPVESQTSLIQYLQQRGGTLVLIAGREAMPQAYELNPLQNILPVTAVETAPADASFRFRVTDEGKRHDALMIGESEEATQSAWDFVNRFAPLQGLSSWRRPTLTAHTLIAAEPRSGSAQANTSRAGDEAPVDAFLCWQPVGRGRVMYLAGPETYRLRFLRGDRLHYRLWGQLLRWAIASDLGAGTDLVRVRTDKSRYGSHEAVQCTVVLSDAQGQPVITDGLEVRLVSDEQQRTAPLLADENRPGEYRAEIRSLPAGVYRIEPAGRAIEDLGGAQSADRKLASFTVQTELPRELMDTRMDRALAQQIAETTGGQVVPPTAVAEILELSDLEPIVTERQERVPLWLEWKYLWLIFGCLQVEWTVRKWKGLS